LEIVRRDFRIKNMVLWTKKVVDRIARVPVRGGRSEKTDKIDFSNLVFVPAQLAKRPVDYFKENISTKTVLGKNTKNLSRSTCQF